MKVQGQTVGLDTEFCLLIIEYREMLAPVLFATFPKRAHYLYAQNHTNLAALGL